MKNKVHQVPALATVAVLSGCFHAALQPPPPHASADERIDAYERLRPQADVQVVGRDGAVIGDGTAVTDSSDLLPVLDRSTPSARAARRSAAAHHSASMWGIGGLIVAGAGISLATLDMVSTSSVDGHNWGPLGEDRGRVGAMVGMTAFAVGIVAGAIGHGYYGMVERREQHEAFVSYDASLRKSLRVCVEGLEVVDCEAKVASTTR